MQIDFQGLKTAFEASTQGVWSVREQRDRKACNSKVDCAAGYAVAEGYSSPSSHIKYNDLWAEAEGNTAFIALAHVAMPTLFEAVELLRKLSSPRGATAKMQEWCDDVEAAQALLEKLK